MAGDFAGAAGVFGDLLSGFFSGPLTPFFSGSPACASMITDWPTTADISLAVAPVAILALAA
jgi:hypothetical protein